MQIKRKSIETKKSQMKEIALCNDRKIINGKVSF